MRNPLAAIRDFVTGRQQLQERLKKSNGPLVDELAPMRGLVWRQQLQADERTSPEYMDTLRNMVRSTTIDPYRGEPLLERLQRKRRFPPPNLSGPDTPDAWGEEYDDGGVGAELPTRFTQNMARSLPEVLTASVTGHSTPRSRIDTVKNTFVSPWGRDDQLPVSTHRTDINTGINFLADSDIRNPMATMPTVSARGIMSTGINDNDGADYFKVPTLSLTPPGPSGEESGVPGWVGKFPGLDRPASSTGAAPEQGQGQEAATSPVVSDSSPEIPQDTGVLPEPPRLETVQQQPTPQMANYLRTMQEVARRPKRSLPGTLAAAAIAGLQGWSSSGGRVSSVKPEAVGKGLQGLVYGPNAWTEYTTKKGMLPMLQKLAEQEGDTNKTAVQMVKDRNQAAIDSYKMGMDRMALGNTLATGSSTIDRNRAQATAFGSLHLLNQANAATSRARFPVGPGENIVTPEILRGFGIPETATRTVTNANGEQVLVINEVALRDYMKKLEPNDANQWSFLAAYHEAEIRRKNPNLKDREVAEKVKVDIGAYINKRGQPKPGKTAKPPTEAQKATQEGTILQKKAEQLIDRFSSRHNDAEALKLILQNGHNYTADVVDRAARIMKDKMRGRSTNTGGMVEAP